MNFPIANPFISCISLADECKKKWKTLRIQQRRLLIKKIRKKGKFNGAQWNCYEPLKFLIPHMDWTSAEESSIKEETHGIATETDQDEDDGDLSNDETMEITQSASAIKSENKPRVSPEDDPLEPATITEQIVYNSQPYQPTGVVNTSTKGQTLSQYLLTYVPTPNQGHQEESLVDATTASNSSTCRTSYTKVIDDSSHIIGATQNVLQSSQTNPTILATSAIPSCQMTSSIEHVLHRSGSAMKDGSVASLSSDLNYFLLDVAQVMNKLNDIAQMELKIEINKLLLAKLRDGKNLQGAS